MMPTYHTRLLGPPKMGSYGPVSPPPRRENQKSQEVQVELLATSKKYT